MFLKTLELVQFKNHTERVLAFEKPINLLIGRNGIGKTNILDAIYYLAVFRSHIHHLDAQNIQQGKDFFRLVGEFADNYHMIVKYTSKQKTIEVNQVKISKYSEYFGHIPLVMSSPSDIFLLHDGSEERRKLLDYTISIFNREYLQKLNVYQQIIEQRNAHLKNAEIVDKSLISYYDKLLVANGQYIFEEREKCLDFLSTAVLKWYKKIAQHDDHIAITYSSQLHGQNFAELLEKNLDKDILIKRSSVGIHRDDIQIEMLHTDLKRIASQGQQKSLLYAIRIAQAEFICQKKNKKILFLLDDFSDKLDSSRKEHLLKIIYEIDFVDQWFITDTEKSNSIDNHRVSVFAI